MTAAAPSSRRFRPGLKVIANGAGIMVLFGAECPLAVNHRSAPTRVLMHSSGLLLHGLPPRDHRNV